MSNSSPRTMRRNAAIRGSTSTNSKANVRGLTLPSLSAWLFPCVRVTVFMSDDGLQTTENGLYPWPPLTSVLRRLSLCRPILDRRLRHAGPRRERFLGGILEGLVGRQH